ncbi:MAG: hypothetical protein CL461_04245 [Acidimicrobiaceae bacterium]|nr:hypothetical protein [Acidimicrobiaceae bacterium]
MMKPEGLCQREHRRKRPTLVEKRPIMAASRTWDVIHKQVEYLFNLTYAAKTIQLKHKVERRLVAVLLWIFC